MGTVVVSPHPDDAALGCWTVLARRRPLVVNAFTGEPASGALGPWDELLGARESRDMVRQRLAEDREALGALGVAVRDLGFLEAQYRGGQPPAAGLADAIAETCTPGTEVYAPAGIGGHADHVLVRDAVLALRRSGRTVHLYAEQPYATRYGWPAWVSSLPSDPNLHPDAYWERALAASPWPRAKLHARVEVLDEAECASKLATLRRYRSQFAALNGGPLGLLTHDAVRAREVTWFVAL